MFSAFRRLDIIIIIHTKKVNLYLLIYLIFFELLHFLALMLEYTNEQLFRNSE